MPSSHDLTTFAPRASDADLDELRRRLRATSWPDAPAGLGSAAGVDVAELRELVAYWADGFDWRAAEARLNSLPRFRTELDGIGIHLVHARAAAGSPSSMPLLLAHGWPDSFWRYSEVVPLLTDPGAHGADPADAFDVVVPDMPGFGYSDAAPRDLDFAGVAGLWARLMERLGHHRFGAAGGDLGSDVVRWVALDHPEQVVAVHRTDAVSMPDYDPAVLAEEERAWLRGREPWERDESAYSALQSTKPQTAAVGLTDSPAGLAAWIVEKLTSWSDHRPDGSSLLGRDAMLTDVTIYWLTGTIGSSMRMYRACEQMPESEFARTIEVPTGYTLFPADVEAPAPDAWLRRTTTDLVSVSRPDRGGHFAPMEDPELYAREIRDFFRPFRSTSSRG
ncbi:epoxide hydrolase family protein [Amnibacterium endophyticum]|uniref:Epoxide hydrolase family protein n=1 Tax=Amnibacterium endophyticum TaxID=2109337 RepID=A0ABW4LJD9_9MICO